MNKSMNANHCIRCCNALYGIAVQSYWVFQIDVEDGVARSTMYVMYTQPTLAAQVLPHRHHRFKRWLKRRRNTVSPILYPWIQSDWRCCRAFQRGGCRHFVPPKSLFINMLNQMSHCTQILNWSTTYWIQSKMFNLKTSVWWTSTSTQLNDVVSNFLLRLN